MTSLHLSDTEHLKLRVALRCLQICREQRDGDLPVELMIIAKNGDTHELLDAERIEALVDKIGGSAPTSIYLVITNGLSAMCAGTDAIPFASLEGAIAHAERQIREWGQNSRYEDGIEQFLAEFNALDENGEPVHYVQIGDSEEIFITMQELKD
jgi:hypothetical protein